MSKTIRAGALSYIVFEVFVAHFVDADQSSCFCISNMLHLVRGFLEANLPQIPDRPSNRRHLRKLSLPTNKFETWGLTRLAAVTLFSQVPLVCLKPGGVDVAGHDISQIVLLGRG